MKHKDKLPGGKADKLNPRHFDKKQLAIGTKHEKEHTKDAKLAMEIAMDHLAEDPQYYTKLKQIEKSNMDKSNFIKQFKKSYDWKDQGVTVDAQDHKAAEQTVPHDLMNHIRNMVPGDMGTVKFMKGTLSLSKTANGLYSGFFSDNDGQVVDKYDSTTLEIIAKNLIVKNFYDLMVPATINAAQTTSPVEASVPQPVEKHADAVEDAALIRDMVSSALREHNDVYHQGQAPFEPITSGKGSLRVRYGNFELEMKKSVQDFVKSFRDNKATYKEDIRKAISAWRRNYAPQHKSDLEAAKALSQGWDKNRESFGQALFAVEQLRKSKNE